MLSRAFTKPRKSPRDGENSGLSVSIHEYDDCIIGFKGDLPFFCDDHDKDTESYYMTLREVLRASVGVMGESRLGMTEKVVLWEGKICAVKRFRKVTLRRREFGRRIARLSQVSRRCEYLVPVDAYLYSKRIKFVVCDYYPMGTLADLLAGARDLGHTALDWNQRLMIILHIARAIAFIHSQSPPRDKHLEINVHGNIRASNIMINIDFTARLSDYGFTQLAERVETSNIWHQKEPPSPENLYCAMLCQESDIYNFGMILLDILGGPKVARFKKCIAERKEEIKVGIHEFFEFFVEGKERNQALQVLDIALACTNRAPDARPSIDLILLYLEDIFTSNKK